MSSSPGPTRTAAAAPRPRSMRLEAVAGDRAGLGLGQPEHAGLGHRGGHRAGHRLAHRQGEHAGPDPQRGQAGQHRRARRAAGTADHQHPSPAVLVAVRDRQRPVAQRGRGRRGSGGQRAASISPGCSVAGAPKAARCSVVVVDRGPPLAVRPVAHQPAHRGVGDRPAAGDLEDPVLVELARRRSGTAGSPRRARRPAAGRAGQPVQVGEEGPDPQHQVGPGLAARRPVVELAEPAGAAPPRPGTGWSRRAW